MSILTWNDVSDIVERKKQSGKQHIGLHLHNHMFCVQTNLLKAAQCYRAISRR